MNEIDDDLVMEFYKNFPDLDDNSCYLLIGGARKKYDRDLDTSYEAIVTRIIETNDPEVFLSEVKKVNAELFYSQTKTKQPISPKSTVIYMTVNPRDYAKAFNDFMKRGIDLYIQKNPNLRKIPRKFISSLHKSPKSTKIRVLDIDFIPYQEGVSDALRHSINDGILSDMISVIGKEYIFNITATRNGYHILYDSSANKHLMGQKALRVINDSVSTKLGKDVTVVSSYADRMTPVWGTMQGGEMVKPYDRM